MTWKEDMNTKFVNPYNFISLGNECKRKSFDDYINNKELLTGYIECELENLTPIFIPNTTNEDAFTDNEKYKSYDFFSYDDIHNQKRTSKYSEPVIPASEIRGVIRAAYEALTDSCMSTIDDSGVLSKRTTIPAKPGLLKKENGEWKLYKAERLMIKVKDCSIDNAKNFKNILSKYNEGDKIYFKRGIEYKNYRIHTVSEISDSNISGYEEGYIHFGEEFIKKHHESIFKLGEMIHDIEITEDDIKKIDALITIYNDLNKDNNDTKYKKFNELLTSKDFENGRRVLPVYYSVYKKDDKSYVYFSPACIGREVFTNKLSDILKSQGGYQPCSSRENLCEACALFGFTGNGSENNALASRLRFTDAKIKNKKTRNEDYYDEICILPELASPKISATEFYLERPYDDKGKTYDMWNYDYAFNWVYQNKIEQFDKYIPKIRGRKFYWHSEKVKFVNEQNERNCKVRPLKKNNVFSFRVYFDAITEDELNKLVWILNIGDSNNMNCHKIGRGKPIGFGTIKIRINKIIKRDISFGGDTISYVLNEYKIDLKQNRPFDYNKKNVQEFLKITDFEKAPRNIDYPIGEDKTKPDGRNSKASHQWFIGNKQIGYGHKDVKIKASGTKPIIYKTLPYILDSDITLNKLYKERD
ncbi:CRISPR-associated RAMP family protein [Thermoanaerobacterium sp. PSU-2]|nr:CRISPR-associated RAMP family protein [Thermoanaerobacterium sp. PSU-2]